MARTYLNLVPRRWVTYAKSKICFLDFVLSKGLHQLTCNLVAFGDDHETTGITIQPVGKVKVRSI
jgi:hypothetical protein